MINLRDYDTVAPERVQVASNMQNPVKIAEWWSDTRLYIDSMRGLDRVVTISHDPDENVFYLSSLPEELP